ncbi:MAG: hypothetical protein ACE5FH_04125 [Candidatus Zixiibacteriota bacterium]
MNRAEVCCRKQDCCAIGHSQGPPQPETPPKAEQVCQEHLNLKADNGTESKIEN